jgi:hypothetical protein
MESRQSMARSGQGTSNEEEYHAPRSRCRCMRAVVNKDCPVHSIPQPASLVHHFSPSGHQHFDGGPEETGVRTPAVIIATSFDLVACKDCT